MLRTLNESEIARVLSYERLIPAMEQALAAFSAGEVQQPVRSMITVEEGQRYLGIMPAVMQGGMGAKLVCFYPKNAAAGLPTHMATILLFDTETARPLACLDGRLITEMRTAAVSAAVTRYLAPADTRVLALLGSGVQAQAHLTALGHVCRFEEVRVWSRNPEHAQRFAARHGARAMDAESAVRGADVVVTVTSSREPVLKGAWLKPGAHVNAVGACLPELARARRRRAARQHADRGFARRGAQGVGRRDPLRRGDPRRGRRGVRRHPARRARVDHGVQVARACGRGHRHRAAGVRRAAGRLISRRGSAPRRS